ncbi:MOSC domain-containing protein [Halenospora varia]|nr:MOSC domain-containing protein [Halenospora varia]
MAPILLPDLDAPWHTTPTTLLQLRTSKMRTMLNLAIETGIYKQPRTTPIFCSLTGLQDDEHDLTFHGGPEKAVHQYYPGHYSVWRKEFPENNGSFEVGGFGENLVASGNMNERNVCIGDVIRIGDGETGVLLQVCLPRQPCFKLNHRFGIKGFAPNTWKKSRTGWYYRVLKEGWIKAGDPFELVQRIYPNWTIERIQEYLHRDKGNLEKLEELVAIPEFGNECKQHFKGLVERARDKENEGKKEPEAWSAFKLVKKKGETVRISSFVFQSVDDSGEGEELDPGSFVRLKLPNGLIRPYSVVGGSTTRFTLGIALEDPSRGGSSFLHNSAKEGDIIEVGKITGSVPIPEGASNHIFIAGGIGITAFLGHMAIYDKINFNYTLHYAVRSAEDVPFKDVLDSMSGKVVVYDKSKGQRMDIQKILKGRAWNSYIYTCGPDRMIDSITRSAAALAIPASDIHYEAFHIEKGGDLFTVSVKGSKKGKIEVGGEETLLEALRKEGWDVDSSCETGNCGTCRVEVCGGNVEHRGSGLSEEEKGKGNVMLSCVSRGVGHLVIDF